MADFRVIKIILIRHVVLIALLTAFMDSASASNVTCNPGIANIVLKAGALAVPMNASPGTIISNIPPDIFQMNCRFLNQSAFLTSGVATIHLTLTAPLAPGFSDVYTTGIQGVGIRYIFNSSVCGVTNVVMTNSAVNLVCAIAGPLGGPYVTDNLTVTPVFVVYGPVSGGGSVISTVPVLTQKYETADNPGVLWTQSPVYTGSASGSLMAATCSVQTDNLAVTLPTPAVRAFAAGVGAVAGRTAFNLQFNCASGAIVSIVLTDVVAPDNRTSILNVTPDSTTKGVGVQILKSDGTPILFGPDAVGTGVANQWLIGSSPNGVLVLPLSAQYIRTGDVTPGSLRALATFTLSYQ